MVCVVSEWCVWLVDVCMVCVVSEWCVWCEWLVSGVYGMCG